MHNIYCEHSSSPSSNQQAESIDEKRPVRLPSTPCLPGRPKYEPGWLKIIATLAEANAIRPHSWASRLKVINQVGESVASVGSSEEDVYYRNDSMKYRRTKEEERGTEIRGTIYYVKAARAQGLPSQIFTTHARPCAQRPTCDFSNCGTGKTGSRSFCAAAVGWTISFCERSRAAIEQVQKIASHALDLHWSKCKVDPIQAALNISEHRNVARSVHFAVRTLHLTDKTGFQGSASTYT